MPSSKLTEKEQARLDMVLQRSAAQASPPWTFAAVCDPAQFVAFALPFWLSEDHNYTITERVMIGLAERMEINAYAGKECDGPAEWAPFRVAAQEDESRVRSRFSGFGVLAALLLFSGVTVAVAKGQAGVVESYGVSVESVLVAAWVAQGAAALFCFVLALRWLRS